MKLRPESAARFAAAGGLVLFLCWQHVQATRLGYRVETARRLERERRGRVELLRVELDSRLSPAEVSAHAARIGLIPAAPDALRRLPELETSSKGLLGRLWARRAASLSATPRT